MAFSACRLSRWDDRENAFLGIVDKMKSLLDSPYALGSWTKPPYLHWSILWFVQPALDNGTPKARCPPKKQAPNHWPSWSWYSVTPEDGAIVGIGSSIGDDRWLAPNLRLKSYSPSAINLNSGEAGAKGMDVNVEVSTTSTHITPGGISALEVTSALVPAYWVGEDEARKDYNGGEFRTGLDVTLSLGYKADDLRVMPDHELGSIGMKKPGFQQLLVIKIIGSPDTISGLIVRKRAVKEDADVYERIGLFEISISGPGDKRLDSLECFLEEDRCMRTITLV